MAIEVADLGSFRDPGGRVFFHDDRVFRTVMPHVAEDFDFVENSGLIAKLEDDGRIVTSRQVEPAQFGQVASGARYVLEHPRLPFISYPYEWSFPALKIAALAHLDIHIQALEFGVTLSDASAYNIQFIGPEPVFIDRLSFQRYRDGEFWVGHRQFCEQFLNPLLLRSLFGISYNSWYRGAQEGIATDDIARLLPWWRKLSWKTLIHIVLPAVLQKRNIKEKVAKEINVYKKQKLPLASMQRMLIQLKNWMNDMQPADTGVSVWGDYAVTHSYSSEEAQRKRHFVTRFIESARPESVWDLGCNTGDYSIAALEAGARHVIGFDFDQKALELGFVRAQEGNYNFLPLYFDAANPAPDQGWSGVERKGFQARASADGLLALAFTHHLAISRNIPLPDLITWLIGLAPQGVIEFVPNSDPMIQRMLCLREDIFFDYTEKNFLACVESVAEIVESEVVSKSGRLLVRYVRR